MKILDWFIKSSADPAKLALTMKGGIPFVLLLAGWAGFGDVITENVANEGINTLINVLVGGLQAATAFIALYGFIRKVVISFRK